MSRFSKDKLLEIYWFIPIKRMPLRFIIFFSALVIGVSFSVGSVEFLINSLPDIDDLKTFDGTLKKVEYLGKRRRGYTTYITVKNDYEEIVFKTFYGKKRADMLRGNLDQPVNILWCYEFHFVKFGNVKIIWDFQINNESVRSYKRFYEVSKGMKSFHDGCAIFTFIIFFWYILLNYSYYRRNNKVN